MKNINSSLPLVKRIPLTKLEQNQFSLSEDLKSILVGLYLGDLYASKGLRCINSHLEFRQGLVHEKYLYHLYNLFSSYCATAPKI